jgi:hypothetical protein
MPNPSGQPGAVVTVAQVGRHQQRLLARVQASPPAADGDPMSTQQLREVGQRAGGQ